MHIHPLSPRGGRLRRLLAAAFCTAAAVTGCLRNPSADVATAQALAEIADQLGAMQQDNAALQHQIDSLRTAVARQDTVLRRLANLAGVPMTP
jgi:septal ring factor EnvC (AmiA/AmiB activator)